jgi:hypothetical protein
MPKELPLKKFKIKMTFEWFLAPKYKNFREPMQNEEAVYKYFIIRLHTVYLHIPSAFERYHFQVILNW